MTTVAMTGATTIPTIDHIRPRMHLAAHTIRPTQLRQVAQALAQTAITLTTTLVLLNLTSISLMFPKITWAMLRRRHRVRRPPRYLVR